jgi:hypothetical protein
MNRWKHLRKQVYVSKEIQGQIVSKLAIYWATYHLALWHAMFLFHYFLYRGQLLANPDLAPVPFPIQYFQFLTQHYTMLVCAMAVFPLILWDMVKMTHRVAGPLVRFTNSLKQLERGEKVKEIRLRDGDLLCEFQDAFNSYLKKCNLLEQDELSARWNDAPARPAATPAAEEREVLDELRGLSELAASPATEESELLQPSEARS